MSYERVSGDPPMAWTSTPALFCDAANLVVLTCHGADWCVSRVSGTLTEQPVPGGARLGFAENRGRPPPGQVPARH